MAFPPRCARCGHTPRRRAPGPRSRTCRAEWRDNTAGASHRRAPLAARQTCPGGCNRPQRIVDSPRTWRTPRHPRLHPALRCVARGREIAPASTRSAPRRELGERRVIHGSILLYAASRVGAKSLQRPPGARHADHRHEQLVATCHRVERREYFLEREVARRPEEDQRVRSVGIHAPALFSTWPPNSKRMAERSRFLKSASPSEANRPNSAAARTLTGSSSSIAASSARRPSALARSASLLSSNRTRAGA